MFKLAVMSAACQTRIRCLGRPPGLRLHLSAGRTAMPNVGRRQDGEHVRLEERHQALRWQYMRTRNRNHDDRRQRGNEVHAACSPALPEDTRSCQNGEHGQEPCGRPACCRKDERPASRARMTKREELQEPNDRAPWGFGSTRGSDALDVAPTRHAPSCPQIVEVHERDGKCQRTT